MKLIKENPIVGEKAVSDVMILIENTKRRYCPYQQKLTPCGTWCALFEKVQGKDKEDPKAYPPKQVHLHCGASRTYDIEGIEP